MKSGQVVTKLAKYTVLSMETVTQGEGVMRTGGILMEYYNTRGHALQQ